LNHIRMVRFPLPFLVNSTVWRTLKESWKVTTVT
jgi:hypothetical protein